MQARIVQPRGEYIIRLSRGEECIQTLTDFCVREKIESGSFHAIGAVENARIGFYALTEKKYTLLTYPEAREVASMTGNIAIVDGSPFVHAHAVLSDMQSNACVGGHVFACTVAVTLEIHLIAFQNTIERTLDNEVGLKLLSV